MTVLFYDVHMDPELERLLRLHRTPGSSVDEVFYADDTVCVTRDPEAMNALIAAIQRTGATYGLCLNRHKSH